MYQRFHSGVARRVGLAGLSVVLFSVSSCGGDDGGGSSADFCKVATKLEESDPLSEAFSGGSSADDLEAAMDQLVKDVNTLDKSAPAEIAKEAALVKESFTALAKALADNDYDVLKASGSAEFAALAEKFESEEFDEAGQRLGDYLERECGIASES